MKTVPQAFYKDASIKKLLVDGLNCILLKQVNVQHLNKERFLAAHAITIVIEGGLKIEKQGEVPKIVNAGEMVFIPMGIYMITDIIPDQGCFEAIVCFFDDTILKEINIPDTDDENINSSDSIVAFPCEQSVKAFCDNLVVLYGNGNDMNEVARLKLLEFLFLLRAGSSGVVFDSTVSKAIRNRRKNIEQIMLENYSRPLGVADYAYLTGRSVSSFRRDFKTRFNTSPKQWLIDRRLSQAADLLSSGRHSVTETAFMIGYENLSHFIAAFRTRYNVSPKQFMLSKRHEKTGTITL